MLELTKKLENRFLEFDLIPQHLGKVIRDHNKTRKRIRKEHFPEVRYGRAVDKQAEPNRFYRNVDEYRLNKIICLDELGLVSDYSRCEL